MENSGCRWDKQEDIQLTKLFKNYSMDIHEMAQIHRRSLESIRLRLMKLGLIKENEQFSLEENKYYLKLLKKMNEQETFIEKLNTRINLLELSNLEQEKRISFLELSSLD
jgi:hypothetical protein